MYHMKTASVRDLRNHFTDVAKWLDSGEAVTITRKGLPIATLSPTQTASPRKIDWRSRLAKRKALGRPLSKAETQAIWKNLRD